MAAKNRATWWIVSTHILTTGLSMPLLAVIVGGFVIEGSGIQGLPAFGIFLLIQAFGYIGGSYYSLNHLQKSTITDDWTKCITPSVIVFVALSMVGFIVISNAVQVKVKESIVVIGLLVVFYGTIIITFSKITAVGFTNLQAQQTRLNKTNNSIQR